MEVGGYRLVMMKKGDIFPSVNELTLCHLFTSTRPRSYTATVSEALRKYTHRQTLFLTCSVVSLCQISLVESD